MIQFKQLRLYIRFIRGDSSLTEPRINLYKKISTASFFELIELCNDYLEHVVAYDEWNR